MTPLTVVFVIGKGRSGSTLLDALLGTMPGVVSLGELSLLWERAAVSGTYSCSCGSPVSSCERWAPALTAAVGGAQPGDLDPVRRLQARAFRWSRAPALLLGARPAPLRRLGDILGRLYEHIARTTGSRILVDSSKWPMHPGVFGAIPNVTPYVAHLVRDPRAVAYSYRRLRRRTGSSRMSRHGSAASALSWLLRNGAAELAARSVPEWRHRLIRYEDLATAPRATIRSFGGWLGIEHADRAFVTDTSVELSATHLIGGNRRRFERGRVTIALDDEWRFEPGRAQVVAALTWPLRRRYGYGAAALPASRPGGQAQE